MRFTDEHIAGALVDIHDELMTVGRRASGQPAVSVIAAFLVANQRMQKRFARLTSSEQELVTALVSSFDEVEKDDNNRKVN